MSCGSSWGTLSSAACTIVAARSSERSSLSEPLKARPMGERAVATMTGSGMADSSDRRGVEGHGTGRQPNGVRSGAAMHGPVGLGTDRREHGGHQRGIARGGGVKAVRAEQARLGGERAGPVSYTHLRAHETVLDLVCRLLLEKKKKHKTTSKKID